MCPCSESASQRVLESSRPRLGENFTVSRFTILTNYFWSTREHCVIRNCKNARSAGSGPSFPKILMFYATIYLLFRIYEFIRKKQKKELIANCTTDAFKGTSYRLIHYLTQDLFAVETPHKIAKENTKNRFIFCTFSASPLLQPLTDPPTNSSDQRTPRAHRWI